MVLINLQTFNISIIKKNKLVYIYVYNNYYFCIFTTKDSINLINNTFLKFKNQNLQNAKLNLFLKQFYICSFSKIKFSGKGYKIKKNCKQSLVLLFNRSHMTTIWWKNIILKKLKKYKLYIKCNYKNLLLTQTILNIRPVNIFTKKGLRSSRQILKKKKGKK
jgi:hypothetical protein